MPRGPLKMFLQWLHDSFESLGTVGVQSFNVVLCVLPFFFALLAWRLWAFTIRPVWHPNEPKELPYWIPCKSLNKPTSYSLYLISLDLGWSLNGNQQRRFPGWK